MYVPNEYMVWLSPPDRDRYQEVEDEVIDELCAYLLEHARREELVMASRPSVSFHTDDECGSGSSGSRRGWCGPPNTRSGNRDRPSTVKR